MLVWFSLLCIFVVVVLLIGAGWCSLALLTWCLPTRRVCMHVYVCMYVCTYARMYVCMYVCMYVYIYIYIHVHSKYICKHVAGSHFFSRTVQGWLALQKADGVDPRANRSNRIRTPASKQHHQCCCLGYDLCSEKATGSMDQVESTSVRCTSTG